MTARKLFFENESHYTLYVLLRTDSGTLEIHLYDAPYSNATAIEPNAGISFEVDVAASVLYPWR